MAIDFGDVDYIAMMREAMEEWYSRPRTGWHVSDIVLCPRQRVFKEIDPQPITDKDLNMYSSGRAIHEAVQSLFKSNPRRFEVEKYVEYNDIEGSIDIYDKKKNSPIEFKTSRSTNIDKPRSFQVEQLRYYMAMHDSSMGYMMYQCLMQFGGSPWRQFKITMNENQRNEQLKKLVREVTSLQRAIKEEDPSLARDVYSDKELNWLCRECPYATECERMRAAAVAGAAA
jgi:CRISPR/Cas system-associated exonuclease Cas4 (RecB family)